MLCGSFPVEGYLERRRLPAELEWLFKPNGSAVVKGVRGEHPPCGHIAIQHHAGRAALPLSVRSSAKSIAGPPSAVEQAEMGR